MLVIPAVRSTIAKSFVVNVGCAVECCSNHFLQAHHVVRTLAESERVKRRNYSSCNVRCTESSETPVRAAGRSVLRAGCLHRPQGYDLPSVPYVDKAYIRVGGQQEGKQKDLRPSLCGLQQHLKHFRYTLPAPDACPDTFHAGSARLAVRIRCRTVRFCKRQHTVPRRVEQIDHDATETLAHETSVFFFRKCWQELTLCNGCNF
jgi:hypothetical protein